MNTNDATNLGAGDDTSVVDPALESTDGQEAAGDTLEELEGGDDGDEDADPAVADDDSEEVEHDGQKYRVPKALKPALMMHADYTRKTQEIAEQRRTLEAERSQHTEASKEYLDGKARLLVIDAQLEHLANTDWGKLWQENPARAGAMQAQREQLKDARAKLDGDLSKMDEERTSAAQRERDKRIQDGNAILAKDIPDWSPALVQKIGEFALNEFGFTPQELGQVTDHRFMKLLHQAFTGKQAATQRQQAQRHQQAQAARPAATVAGAAPVRKDPNRMSTDEWMAHRNAQLQKKAGR